MNNEKDSASNSGTLPSATVSVHGMGKQLGASGTIINRGMISGEEYNIRLTGKFALRQYEIMRRSESSVEGALEVIKQPILNVERRIDPASDDEGDKYAARFIQREFFDGNIDFQQLAEEALTFLDFGHCVMEIELHLTEFEGKTRVGIKSIEFRKQISIEKWETEDSKPGITQQLSVAKDGKTTISIPRQKLIYWVNKKEGDNHLGVSLLRYAFKDWDFKDKVGIIHMIALEKGGVPTPILGMPEGKEGSPELALAIESLRQYRSNEQAYIIKPFGWELTSFDMTGQSLKEFLPTEQYCDRQIFMSVLAGFLALGASDASGSRSVGEVQYKPYIQKISTINKRFETPLQALIKLVCSFNFSEMPNGPPKLKSGRFSDDDISALAKAVKDLKDAGFITPGYEDEKHIRKTLHMPDAPEELEEMYQLKHEQSIEMIKNPPQAVPPDSNPNAPQPKSVEKSNPAKTKASIIRDAQNVQRRLIDVIVRG